jgi:hypothetical protein
MYAALRVELRCGLGRLQATDKVPSPGVWPQPLNRIVPSLSPPKSNPTRHFRAGLQVVPCLRDWFVADSAEGVCRKREHAQRPVPHSLRRVGYAMAGHFTDKVDFPTLRQKQPRMGHPSISGGDKAKSR